MRPEGCVLTAQVEPFSFYLTLECIMDRGVGGAMPSRRWLKRAGGQRRIGVCRAVNLTKCHLDLRMPKRPVRHLSRYSTTHAFIAFARSPWYVAP